MDDLITNSNKLPDAITVINPFDLEIGTNISFNLRSFKSNIYGKRDQLIRKNLRMFIAREFRPRIKEWFDSFPKEGRYNESINVLKRIEDAILQILTDLDADHLSETIQKETATFLFDSVEVEAFIPTAVSLICSSFKVFRQSETFGTTKLYEILKEMSSDFVDVVPGNELLFINHADCLTALFLSWLGFEAFLTRALKISYTLICSSFYTQIYNHNSNISLADFHAIEEAMQLWAKSFTTESDSISRMYEEVRVIVFRKIIDELSPKIYSIIIDGWPRTAPTIETLHHCLSHSQNYGRTEMINNLLLAVRTRLLTVQENTSVILDGYANCVHALKAMDPSCSFMHHVCGEIREFLKKRPDTVRKIIHYITTVKRDQLTEYLGNNPGTIIDEEDFFGTNDEFLPDMLDSKGWQNWMPDPPDAPFGKSSHLRRLADVFNMLISVYGTKEVFVKEYRKLLAKRLTSSVDKDSIFELRYLGVLKQRFNEGELAHCEVMLKDVDESQRVDIAASHTQEAPITATVISSHFWPLPELDESTELPKKLEEGLEFYSEIYHRYKPSRKLKWMKSWGWTEMDITIGNKTISRFISNHHAVVLYLFMEKESWSPIEVAEKLSISRGNARRRLEWWGNEGILFQELPNGATSEMWTLSMNAKALEQKDNQGDEESDEEDAATIEDAADAADALEAYWIYTKNYITQNESVKAERIHKIYRMFTSPSSQGPSIDVVNAFLFRKVKQNLLTYQSGSFRVVKEPGQ